MAPQNEGVEGDAGVRIHYHLPTALHHRIKAEAALRGSTLKDFLIQALEKAVKEGFSENQGK